ncbi:hypothetical protein G6016_11030 [Dietzia aerolata]|uniref:Uncharacterized protein n=1 Tax=Dietzia aerolata TaxID=595984 RepID=A0ABV5JLJ3_9ACTN|nr:hypothetical protein [Dietzia aerolata]MBB0969482.1 hypothetical protein [Dietzia aerolata]
MSKTLRQIETELEAIRTEARDTARRLKSDGYHTPDGVENTFARYRKHGDWDSKVDELAAAAEAAIDSAAQKRDQLRAQMVTTTGTPEDQLRAELRFQRRLRFLESVITSGSGELVDLIASASPEDVPLIVEHASDHYRAKGGQVAEAGMAMIDHALQQRDPEYAAAASTAGRAESTRHVIAEKLRYVQDAVTNPDASDPTPGGVATVSVSAAGDDVASLAA